MVKVKICGITNVDDALTAINYGADAVGFLVGQVHYTTGFFLDSDKVNDIITNLPPFCSTVLVTHLSRTKDVIQSVLESNVNTIQLHGETSPKEAREIKDRLPYIKTYKVIHVFDETAIEEAKTYERYVDGIVLDTAIKETGQVGGTGKTHDWGISRKLVELVKLPIILAGGLNMENVEEAIKIVKPYAVDVNSGVTNMNDGTKNYIKLKSFIEKAKFMKN